MITALRYFLFNGLMGLINIPLFYIFNAEHHILSFFMGVFIIAAEMALVIYIGRSILIKKSIAHTLPIIVFKYAVLGVAIYQVLESQRFSNLSFLFGLCTFLPALILFVIKYPNLEVK